MQSLKDKLMKAGLVSEADVKKAEAPAAAKAKIPDSLPEEKLSGSRSPSGPPARSASPRPPSNARPPSRPAPRFESRKPESAPASRLPKFAPLQGSAAANREASRKQVQLDKNIRDLVVAGGVPVDDGATPFYYVTRKNKLRRLFVTEAQAKLIQDGELAIAERPDPGQIEHQLVSRECAEALLKLSDKTVRFFNKAGQSVGFLSDAEIANRAAEADAPAEKSESVGEVAADSEPEKPAEETWVTIKRSSTP